MLADVDAAGARAQEAVASSETTLADAKATLSTLQGEELDLENVYVWYNIMDQFCNLEHGRSLDHRCLK